MNLLRRKSMRLLKENIGGITMCIFELLVGILLLINPVNFTSGIIIALGVLFLPIGIIEILVYFHLDPLEAAKRQSLTKGIVVILAGLFCIFKTNWFIVTFPLLTIMYGVIILFMGVAKIQWAVDMLRMKKQNWFLAAIASGLCMAIAIIILMSPFESTLFFWRFIAVALIVEAVLDILALVFAKRKKEQGI